MPRIEASSPSSSVAAEDDSGHHAARTRPAVGRKDDDIVVLELNPHSPQEGDELSHHAKVTRLGNHPRGVTVTDAAGRTRTLDLHAAKNVDAFATSLRLPDWQTREVARILRSADPDIRDELAQVAKVWARAEHGGSIPGRMVLSGHAYGPGMFGTGNGTLRMSTFAELARAMPRAAAQIHDLQLAGCNTAFGDNFELLRRSFPNLSTLWGYLGTAPGAASGAAVHAQRWERATRGTEADLARSTAAGTRYGQDVVTWSRVHGTQSTWPPRPLSRIRDELTARTPAARQAFSGALEVKDPQHGPLRDYYQTLQELAGHPDLDPAERARLEPELQRTVKLLYFTPAILTAFARTYGRELEAGYRAVGRPVPDFAHLSRREAVAEAERFAGGAACTPDRAVRRAAELLTRGLVDLDPALVPLSWT